jgi:hypothetical protein
MIEAVMSLLAKKSRPDDHLARVLDQITNGGYYFFDLELTVKEAESLGYCRLNAPVLYSSQRPSPIRRLPGTGEVPF